MKRLKYFPFFLTSLFHYFSFVCDVPVTMTRYMYVINVCISSYVGKSFKHSVIAGSDRGHTELYCLEMRAKVDVTKQVTSILVRCLYSGALWDQLP